MTLFDQRLSWKIQAGAVRVRDGACKSCFVGRGLVGSGAAFAFGPLVLFATADLTAQAGPGLDGINGARYRAGIGPAGGARLRLGDRLTLLGQGGTTWYPGTNTQWSWSAAASVRVNLLESVGISLEGRALPEAREAAVRLHWFY